MKKLLVLLVLGVLLTSCRSGWSCKKSYVDKEKPLTEQQVKC